MTLLVTERSTLGIVMVADTQETFREAGVRRRRSGVGKIAYSPTLNVALGGWGEAAIGPVRLDNWMTQFLGGSWPAGISVRELGLRLVDQANTELERFSGPGSELRRRGIHIAGFEGSHAVIYHVHMGPGHSVGPLALEDTVELGAIEKGVTREVALHRGTTQVRNGIYPAFVEAWDREVERAGWGDMSSLAARAAHYPPLFDKVSKTQEGIDSSVSLVAFSASGVAVDGLVARRQADEYETCDWTELQWCAHAP